ncbi:MULTISPECIES: hypothetical protein [Candidatus Nitrosocaldus]|jgi:hypothetical protein|uniref:Uncharacterized protein n=1 Tax=Candidatus Nitrosocaldus cavascurensis TaxID=2058097 RepID=A0A2K5ARF0_9ARCH|nr:MULTISPECIES: hypothetical protein [Candidatus Nitrosocaldus]SPC34218.1 membrane protein of unknown function [Candidatus Nitrosocaldus cavascurensis]
MMISKSIVRTRRARTRTTGTSTGRTGSWLGFILQEVTEDERARWLRLLVILGIAGFLLIFARDIINFMTGINMPTSISCASGSNVFITGIGLLPCDTVRAMVNLFNLARFAGVAVAAGGGAFAIVKL